MEQCDQKFEKKPKSVKDIRNGEERLKDIQDFVKGAFEHDLFEWNYDRKGASLTIRVEDGPGREKLLKDLSRLIVDRAI
jgi:hypothetical protein